MKLLSRVPLFLLLAATGIAAESAATAERSVLSAGDWRYVELRRFPAPEARQGVAADDQYLYVISNHGLGKYRKDTGARVDGWECPKGQPLIHLNAGIVYRGVLYCAHSNFPGVPMISSVECWDPATMKHIGTHSFGRTDGSLTWIDRYKDGWVACFVHYGRQGGEPGRGPEWTRLVTFDNEWRPIGGWVFPAGLVAKLGSQGFSISGGAFGPGGHLYVTGHDDPALHLLAIPDGGPTLEWIGSIPMSAQGQGFCWDPREPGLLYTLSKQAKEVIVGRLMNSTTSATKWPATR